jgi:hypothetical protein
MRNSNEANVYYVEFTDESDIPKWESIMGMKFKLTSELPKVTKNKGPVKVLIWNGNHSENRSCWNEETLSATAFSDLKGYYVDASGWNILRGEEDVTTKISGMIKYAVQLGLIKIEKNVKIIALRKSAKESFIDDPNWINFFTHVDEVGKKYFADPQVLLQLNDHIAFKKFSEREQLIRIFTYNIWDQKWFEKEPYTTHPFTQYISKIVKLNKSNTQIIDANIDLAKLLGIELIVSNGGTDFAKVWEDYKKKYPMVTLLTRQNSYTQKADLEIILDYIK